MKNILKLCLGMWLLNMTVEAVEEATRPEPIKEKEPSEKDYILNLIKELKSKKNKTQKDKNNLGLLEVKLKQLSV